LGADRAANLLRCFQILIVLFVAFLLDVSCGLFVFVATRHLFERIAPSGVMHSFVGGKFELEKPRGYPPRREL
jgi:hypothetical protein